MQVALSVRRSARLVARERENQSSGGERFFPEARFARQRAPAAARLCDPLGCSGPLPPRGAPHSTARPANRLCIALFLTMSILQVVPCRVSPATAPRRAPTPARAGAQSVVVAGARGAVRASPLGSLRARPTRRVSRRAAGARAAIETDGPFPYPVIDRTPKTLTLHIGESVVTIETGRVGLQANGAVMVTEGETVMYTTCCAGREVTADGGFVPLTVNYQERFSAVGKTPGGYRKRDGGVRENETLIGRLVDRPLRPMIPKGWAYDTQILEWVLSYDGVRSTDALAITAASAAAAISDVPLKKPVAGVRVGLLPGETEPILNPTSEQMSRSRLDLVLAGTEDAVMMIEGFGDFLTVDEMLYAIEKGHEAVAKACKDIKAWAKEVGREKKTDKMLVAPEGVDAAVAEAVGPDLATAMAIGPKQMRGAAVEKVRNVAMDALKDQFQVRVGGARRRVAPIRFRFFFFPARRTSPKKSVFPDRQKRAHSPKGPRRVPLVGPRASGPTAEGAERNPRSLRTHARPTLGSHPGTSDVVALHVPDISRFLRPEAFFPHPAILFRHVRSFAPVSPRIDSLPCCSLSLSLLFFLSRRQPPRITHSSILAGDGCSSRVRPRRVARHSQHDS